ncbi:dynein light chain roadblock-type 2 isoform X2 [Mercenaria mercenaria]|uniref:dynein light chain roadblock-type 2 isoform X2 n=1 Tax=Mercenaria mercenaria TaxID=6596 RepID=UPI00234E98EA|nr:dynein light chain roadblock-type 2 isoform X2 [Mercenaria mercenaria]
MIISPIYQAWKHCNQTISENICELRSCGSQELDISVRCFCLSVVNLLCIISEVEETIKRITGHKGVIGVIVVNSEGIPIRTTLDNSTTVQYAGLIHHLTSKARSTVRDIDPQNDLTFLRIRSKKHEIMIAPDKEYLLIVIQSPNDN